VLVSCGQLRKDAELCIRQRGAVIVEVEAGTYVSDQYQCLIKAPEVCPNCGIVQSLEARGYYWRWVTKAVWAKSYEWQCGVFFVSLYQLHGLRRPLGSCSRSAGVRDLKI